MPCFRPKTAWLPPEPLPEDIYVTKDGREISSSRRLVFRPPIGAYRQREYRVLQVPCGRCAGCRERDSRDWAIRLTCEASQHQESCFITLTYDREHLPRSGSVGKREMQLFLKKLRNHFPQWRLRYFLCGEYGGTTGRPHYHVCLFGVGFLADREPAGKSKGGHPLYESATLSKLWGKGRATVQDLTRETAAYCARYTNKKIAEVADRVRVLPDGRTVRLAPEFLLMSRRPGLGADWFRKFGRHDVYGGSNGAYVDRGGHHVVAPRYFDKLLEVADPARYAEIRERRIEQANRVQALRESAPTRLAVREQVQQAQHATQRRARDGV